MCHGPGPYDPGACCRDNILTEAIWRSPKFREGSIDRDSQEQCDMARFDSLCNFLPDTGCTFILQNFDLNLD